MSPITDFKPGKKGQGCKIMEHSLRKQPVISPVSESHHGLEKDEAEF